MDYDGFNFKAAIGGRCAISAGCIEAVEVAQEVFRNGGNIVDAAIAAVGVSCVVMPHMTGIGGQLQALVSLNGAAPRAFIAAGLAGEKASVESYRRMGLRDVPVTGGAAVETPALPHGLIALRDAFGSRSLSELLDPAIQMAEHGFIVRDHLAKAIRSRQGDFQEMRKWKEMFCPEGVPLTKGSILKQEQLAKTLRAIANKGIRAFTAGWIADDIASSVQSAGGLMTVADMSATAAEEVIPIYCDYNNFRVFTQPPISQGFILLRALKLLEAMPSTGVDVWMEATSCLQRAFSERIAYLCDDGVQSSQQVERLLRTGAQPLLNSELPVSANAGGNTTVLAIMDGTGNAISVIHSIYDDFGSGLVTERSGILLNNRLSSFFLNEKYPNHLRPRKKSMSTLHTFMLLDEGGIRWTGGSPGADDQPQVNLHLIVHLLNKHATPAEAVGKPRWSVYPGTKPSDVVSEIAPYIVYEPGVREAIIEALRTKYQMQKLTDRNIGSSKLVGRIDSQLIGAWTDLRREGAVGIV